jgi:two-component system sensor histidine kinase TctE
VSAALGRHASLRRRLLWWTLAPLSLLMVVNAAALYRQSLRAADTAYDRTLLASAKSLGEQLEIDVADNGRQRIRATVPYAALEAFEADTRSRMYYRIAGIDGETVLGYADLALPPPLARPARTPYAALVEFRDADYRGVPVRMAVLQQPVASANAQGMAVVQVAETLELRQTLAREMLADTLWRELLWIAVAAAVIVLVVQRATKPIRELSQQLERRPENDLTPLTPVDTPGELVPLVDATNGVMQRLSQLLDHQKRFVRDASHQLRTPLAVLKAQVQSAKRGDVDGRTALDEIEATVDAATRVANQMLALAKVEQVRQQGELSAQDWGAVARDVALELAPLIAERDIDFDVRVSQGAIVRAHEWSLRELTRNLLHNAIKHAPRGSALVLEVGADTMHAALRVEDEGPGIAPEVMGRITQPFVSGDPRSGSGLGLAICHEVLVSLGGALALVNKLSNEPGRHSAGLVATAQLPRNAGAPAMEAKVLEATHVASPAGARVHAPGITQTASRDGAV